MKKKLILFLFLISFLLIIGCTSNYTRNEFCYQRGFYKTAWVTSSDSSTEFFCYNHNTTTIMPSEIFKERDRLKCSDCCGCN